MVNIIVDGIEVNHKDDSSLKNIFKLPTLSQDVKIYILSKILK